MGHFLAQRARASLVVLHLGPTGSGGGSGDAAANLHSAVEELYAAGLSVTKRVASSVHASTILTTAQHEQVDLIIMAPPARARHGAFGRAGVTSRLLSRSPIALLLLPTKMDRADISRGTAAPIMVPLDGSVTAEYALPVAVDAAKLFEQPLLLVRVARPFLSSGVAESEARAYLDALRQFVAAAGAPSIATSVVIDRPADGILWIAEGRGASLIVMSAPGRGALARAVAGGVAPEVIERAPVPVLIIPTSPSARRPTGPEATVATPRQDGNTSVGR
jgi:nucleotide-binding universal stress UspA family protein